MNSIHQKDNNPKNIYTLSYSFKIGEAKIYSIKKKKTSPLTLVGDFNTPFSVTDGGHHTDRERNEQ